MEGTASTVEKNEVTRQTPLRGFTHIVAGNGLGQIVTLLALPVLSRLYSPDEYGLLALALSIVGVMGPMALLGMNSAVVVPPRDSDVAPLAVVGLISLIITSIIVGIIIHFWSLQFAEQYSRQLFFTIALPVLMVMTGVNVLLSHLAMRSGEYSSIGRRNGLLSITTTLSQLMLSGTAGILWFNGLVGGTIIGCLFGIILLYRFARRFARRVSLVECFRAVRANWRFPAIFAPMTTVTQLAQQTPILFVLYWFGAAEGGQVGMAERVVAVPLALLGVASSTIFIGELSHAARRGTGGLTKIFLTTSRWLGLLGLLVMVALIFLANLVVPIFLGEEWETAANIAQLMAVVAATRIVTTPIRELFGLLKRARLITYAELIRFTLLLIAIAVCIALQLPLLTSLSLIYLVLAASDAIMWLFALSAVRFADRQV